MGTDFTSTPAQSWRKHRSCVPYDSTINARFHANIAVFLRNHGIGLSLAQEPPFQSALYVEGSGVL
jgi:hypothetical protein